MAVSIQEHVPAPASTSLSLTRAADILGVSKPVVQKGLKGGTIRDLSMATIGELAARPVLDAVEVDGVPVPVLRPGLAVRYSGESRPFSGWDVDGADRDLRRALDRWWTGPGRDLIVAAGGYLVAVGSVVCAGLRLRSGEQTLERQDGRIRYFADLAGRLTRNGEKKVLVDPHEDWHELMQSTLSKRVLGGGGGNFTRIG